VPADPRQQLLEIFLAAVAAVGGRARVAGYLRAHPLTAPVYLIAIGKAAGAMAQGAHDALGDRIHDGFIVTKRGGAETLPWPVFEAGHPLPDESSLEAGQKLIQFVKSIPRDTQVLVLLSGGASALVEALPAGVGLREWQDINRWLLASGLDIRAMNAVRKRISRIKGGRLAQLLYPRKVLCLAISDVPGDAPHSIGSGPLTADETSALPDLAGAPESLQAALSKVPPLPKTDDPCFRNVEFKIIATLADTKQAAVEKAEKLGYAVKEHPEFIGGDAIETGTRLAHELLESEPGIVQVWGGETTIKLPPRPGRGGRNQSLALSAALVLQHHKNAWLLAAGTDGTDGPTEDAGALVDEETITRGELHGLKGREALVKADAGTFLEASGDLIQTGPTGTNVMDLMLGLKT
jgi:hydroxypyruvate reductase